MPKKNKEKLESQLVEALGEELIPKGYSHVAAHHQFRRENPGGFQCVIYSWTHYEDLSLLELYVGIRLDAVEGLAFPMTSGVSGFAADSLTLVTPLAKLRGRRHQRYKIETAADLKSVLPELKDWLRKDGLPFLEKYNDKSSMDALFNEAPEKLLPYLHNAANRCLRGITLAKINRRNNFENLVTQYRQQLKIQRASESTLRNYNRLVDLLRQYEPE